MTYKNINQHYILPKIAITAGKRKIPLVHSKIPAAVKGHTQVQVEDLY